MAIIEDHQQIELSHILYAILVMSSRHLATLADLSPLAKPMHATMEDGTELASDTTNCPGPDALPRIPFWHHVLPADFVSFALDVTVLLNVISKHRQSELYLAGHWSLLGYTECCSA